jgi:hypothetical protein
MKYTDKLRDPRWQKKRLQILEKNNWACFSCGDTKSTLNVHHIMYEKNKEPWDVDDSNLTTLCEACHFSEHTLRKKYEDQFLGILKSKGFMVYDIYNLIEVLDLINYKRYKPRDISRILYIALIKRIKRLSNELKKTENKVKFEIADFRKN